MAAKTDAAPVHGAGVLELWVLDVRGEAITVHREPTPEGYQVNCTLHRGDRLAHAALPDLEFAVDDILG